MIFTETRLEGACTIDVEPHEDERGFFARCWCEQELAEYGLNTTVAQASIAYNEVEGTLRGMHWQVATQLHGEGLEFTAPNLQYLMDSPAEFGPIAMRLRHRSRSRRRRSAARSRC